MALDFFRRKRGCRGQKGMRIEVGFVEKDVLGEHIMASIRNDLGIDVHSVRTADVYLTDLEEREAKKVAEELLTDRITQSYSLNSIFSDYDWLVEVGFLKGVTDNAAQAAAEGIEDVINRKAAVRTAKLYAIKGKLSKERVRTICEKLLANALLQYFTITQTKR